MLSYCIQVYISEPVMSITFVVLKMVVFWVAMNRPDDGGSKDL
jgi:hypothetical protein